MPVFDLAECLPKLAAYFASQPSVALAYVFGSQVRGKAGPLSDLDVAVLLAGEPTPAECTDRRLDFIGDLMRLLQTNDVDVVVLNVAPLALRYAVLRSGRLVFARQQQEAIEFRVQTASRYFDFRPLLERHQRIFFERIKRGEFSRGYNPYRGQAVPNPPLPATVAGDSEA